MPATNQLCRDYCKTSDHHAVSTSSCLIRINSLLCSYLSVALRFEYLGPLAAAQLSGESGGGEEEGEGKENANLQ